MIVVQSPASFNETITAYIHVIERKCQQRRLDADTMARYGVKLGEWCQTYANAYKLGIRS